MPATPATLIAPRVEVRPLTTSRALITTPTGTSFTVAADASTVLRIVDAWTTGEASPLLAEGWDNAAALLHEILERDGTFTDPNPTGALADVPAVYDDGDGSAAQPGELLLTGDPHIIAGLQQASGSQTLRAVPDDDWQRVIHRAFGTGELLVYALHSSDEATLVTFDRLCSDARTPWVALEVSRSVIWLGPFVTPCCRYPTA